MAMVPTWDWKYNYKRYVYNVSSPNYIQKRQFYIPGTTRTQNTFRTTAI